MMIEEHELMPNEVCPDDLESRLAAIRERGYETMESEQSVAVQKPVGAGFRTQQERRGGPFVPLHRLERSCRNPRRRRDDRDDLRLGSADRTGGRRPDLNR